MIHWGDLNRRSTRQISSQNRIPKFDDGTSVSIQIGFTTTFLAMSVLHGRRVDKCNIANRRLHRLRRWCYTDALLTSSTLVLHGCHGQRFRARPTNILVLVEKRQFHCRAWLEFARRLLLHRIGDVIALVAQLQLSFECCCRFPSECCCHLPYDDGD